MELREQLQQDGHLGTRGDDVLLATIKGKVQSLALGTYEWTIYNDTKQCNVEGESYTAMMGNSTVLMGLVFLLRIDVMGRLTVLTYQMK